MQKKHISLPVKFSLKITAAISFFLILLFVFFTCLLKISLNNKKSAELLSASEKIVNILEEDDSRIDSALLDLPYFIAYSIFYEENGESFRTNDTFVPKLAATNGKTIHYVAKNYYIDGNFDVLYMTKEKIKDGLYFVQVAIDIENDSATKMIFILPVAIPIVMIPVAVLTFLILLFFIKKDFEREHAFSANVSHELQTPVNVILGHANMLKRWGKNDQQQLENSLDIITSEAHSMKATVTNLLQIAKLEKNMVELKKDAIFVSDFFESISKEFKYENNVKFNYDLQISDSQKNKNLNISTDYELLHQLFVIVISNSIKFSPKPCTIQLKFNIEDGKFVFEIQDNGPGFSKEILPHVFERFYRGDSSHSRSKGGAGLGLSIAKSISTALNLKITAKNAAEGGGIIRIEEF